MAQSTLEQSEPQTRDTVSTQHPSRRSFVVIAISTGVAAFCALRHVSTSIVEASGRAADSGSVTIVQYSDLGKSTGKVSVPRVIKSDSDWQQQLSPSAYEVTRHAATERPYTGSTWDNHARGIYRCICCDNALFSSETKFESGTGWPSFWQPIAKENVVEIKDETLGMSRTEVKCRQCDAHLGHVFDDGPRPSGMRYCMNSAAMKFVKMAR